jgi:hypothetical protein
MSTEFLVGQNARKRVSHMVLVVTYHHTGLVPEQWRDSALFGDHDGRPCRNRLCRRVPEIFVA